MLLRTYIPQMPLCKYVDCFWYMEDYNPSHSRELTLPDGAMDVVIDLGRELIRLYDRNNVEFVFLTAFPDRH